MSFIVIEGLDGSGKSTQIKLLLNHFIDIGLKYEFIHFPTKDSPFFGDLVSKFLRGEFGNLHEVNPYLVALLFAGDQYNLSEKIRNSLKQGKFVICDRYVYSNVAYQCAKIENLKESYKLFKWILALQYDYFKIPKPDLSIFLDVPFSFTQKKLIEPREGECREYLNGKKDIHESDLDFQKRVKQVYDIALEKDKSFISLKCHKNEQMLSPEAISKLIIKELEIRAL